jgi:hypothetical protein
MRIPWHVIDDVPTIKGQPILNFPWLNVYRSVDWGFFPDPAVCLWHAVLPNKQAITFKERTWRRTLAVDVAKQIARESEGFRVVETMCDPTMFITHGETAFSIGEIFEQTGIPLTPSISRRDLLGYAIHQYLNTIIDERPQLQIVRGMGPIGCPELIRTLPQIRMDPHDPTKMAEGDDHHVIALAFFCAGGASPSQNPVEEQVPFWMQPKRRGRY